MEYAELAALKSPNGSEARKTFQGRAAYIGKAAEHMERVGLDLVNWWDYYSPSPVGSALTLLPVGILTERIAKNACNRTGGEAFSDGDLNCSKTVQVS